MTALDFRASWMKAFSNEGTRTETFRVGPGESVDVPMRNDVSRTMALGYLDGGSSQAREQPCGSRGEFAMVVLPPREESGLPELEAALAPEAWVSWTSRFERPEAILVAMPRFRLWVAGGIGERLAEMGTPPAWGTRRNGTCNRRASKRPRRWP